MRCHVTMPVETVTVGALLWADTARRAREATDRLAAIAARAAEQLPKYGTVTEREPTEYQARRAYAEWCDDNTNALDGIDPGGALLDAVKCSGLQGAWRSVVLAELAQGRGHVRRALWLTACRRASSVTDWPAIERELRGLCEDCGVRVNADAGTWREIERAPDPELAAARARIAELEADRLREKEPPF